MSGLGEKWLRSAVFGVACMGASHAWAQMQSYENYDQVEAQEADQRQASGEADGGGQDYSLQEAYARVGGVFSMGLTRGFSKFFTVRYTDGTEQRITPGGTFEVKVGGEIRLNRVPLSAQATIGYHYDSTHATNGSITFTKVPLELLGFWNITPKYKLGGGMRYVTMAKLKGNGVAQALGTNNFKNTLGMVLEGEYLINSKTGVALRYVSETYQLEGASYKIDGNHVGLRFNVYY